MQTSPRSAAPEAPRATSSRERRVPIAEFHWEAFAWTAGGLIVAPVAASANLFHSYTPFLLLRLWVVGFAIYGASLARRAGGVRRLWAVVYIAIGAAFALVWGLDVESWAAIDLGSAAVVGLSAFFLRTEPAGQGAVDDRSHLAEADMTNRLVRCNQCRGVYGMRERKCPNCGAHRLDSVPVAGP